MPGRTHTFALMLTAILMAGCQSTGSPRPDTGSTPVAAPETKSEIAQIKTQLGIGYLRANRLELAWKRLHEAIEADPDYSTAHNAMALLYDRLGDPQKAEEHFLKAIRASPNDSVAQTNYGSLLCAQGRYEEGEERFMQAVKNSLYDEPELAYTNAGLCAMKAGDDASAETYFRSALTIDPRTPQALIGMSELSFGQARYLQARAYLQRYLEVSEHSSRSLWLGIRIERNLGDRNTESSYAMLLKATYPDSHETRQLLDSESR